LIATLGAVTSYQNTGLSAATSYAYTVQLSMRPQCFGSIRLGKRDHESGSGHDSAQRSDEACAPTKALLPRPQKICVRGTGSIPTEPRQNIRGADDGLTVTYIRVGRIG
jgi:hypothetical protein